LGSVLFGLLFLGLSMGLDDHDPSVPKYFWSDPDADADLHVRRWWLALAINYPRNGFADFSFTSLFNFFSLVAVFSSPDKLKYASDTFERGA